MKKIELEELKKIQFDILKEIAKFCDENGIKYFICSGTLLGAIRHKGFIPWDDDIDVMMKRRDYEKFLKLFNDKNVNNIYYVDSCETNNRCPCPFARVYNTKTILFKHPSRSYEYSVHVSIFPVDNLPDNVNLYKRQYKRIRFYRNIDILKALEKNKGRALYKKFILFFGRNIFGFISFNKLARMINQIATKYSDNSECKYIACLVWGSGEHEKFPKSCLEEQIEVEFEGEFFKAPKGYHEILHNFYDDYMTPPPPEKRISNHNFEAYWKE